MSTNTNKMYKVKDLIEDLKKFDPELPVFNFDHEYGYSFALAPKEYNYIEIQYYFSNKEPDHFEKGVVV